ncbi:MAG: hypothetical protein J5601_05730 [Elusimicrobiaceae bacterium]|nr:hypothetical protein [Elusimicrobiaceae bacterium]
MYSALKKGISLFIAFIFFFTNTFPIYAQKLPGGPRLLESAPTRFEPPAQPKVDQGVQKKGKEAKDEQLSEVEKASRVIGIACLISDAVTPGCILQGLRVAGADPEDPEKEICIEQVTFEGDKKYTKKYCGASITVAQGGIHRIVRDKNGLYSNKKAVKKEAGNMLNLISSWGIYYKAGETQGDVAFIRQYFYDVTSTITCGKSGFTAPGLPQITAVQNQHCAEEVDGLIGIAMLAQKFGNEAERTKAISAIMHYINKAWNTSDGATVVTGGVTALVLLSAWNNIDHFLTDVARPWGKNTNATGGTLLDLLSVEWIATNLYGGSKERARKSTRYYNETNDGFSYVNEGICAANPKTFGTPIRQKKDGELHYVRPGYQYPYTNTFEEIGHIIGAEAQEEVRTNRTNGPAGDLAKKIIGRAIRYAEDPYFTRTYYDDYGKPIVSAKTKTKTNFNGHWPVVVGILSASTKYPNYIVPAGKKTGMYDLIILLVGDF